jgi:glycerol kinase
MPPPAARRCFGNIDTWVIWNLTGARDGGSHVTDITNASRTMLMDLRTLAWDEDLLSIFKIPRAMLPTIRSSSESASYGVTRRSGPVAVKCRSAETSAISRRRRSGRSACHPARRRTRTAPATSCS